MAKEKIIRSKWLTVRLSETETKKLSGLFQKTTCSSLSEYARNVLLKEPVTVLFRNQSADSFLEEMLHLKKELNAIGNNFNQAVHKLHTLDHSAQVKSWAEHYDYQLRLFQAKAEEIQRKLHQIHQQWSQK